MTFLGTPACRSIWRRLRLLDETQSPLPHSLHDAARLGHNLGACEHSLKTARMAGGAESRRAEAGLYSLMLAMSGYYGTFWSLQASVYLTLVVNSSCGAFRSQCGKLTAVSDTILRV
jgi:hypothetical protein